MTTEFEVDYIIRLIVSRCDCLDVETLAEVESRLQERPIVQIDPERSDRLANVLEQFDARMSDLERARAVAAAEEALGENGVAFH
jgi:hypothetical protein